MSLVPLRHRGDPRANVPLTVGAMIAALGIAAPTPAPVVQEFVPGAVVTREALPPLERKVAVKPAAKQPHRDAPRGRWTFYRDGAVDPLGTFHSYRALRRALFSHEDNFGRMSGRQWVKFRKRLRREMPDLAEQTVPELVFGRGKARAG